MIFEPSGKSLVTYLGGQSWPIFGQKKSEFFNTVVQSLFNKKSSNQFYIRIYIQIYDILFCFLFKVLPFVSLLNRHFLVSC